ncbi:MAG TPA: DUF6134 family protein [Flavisolibacter sp.]
MIPTIMMLLLRRYRKVNPEGYVLLRKRVSRIARIMFLLVIATGIANAAKAQNRQLTYTVMKGDSEVGSMYVSEVISGSRINLKLNLDVTIKFLFSFSAKGVEEAVYDNGVLVYSYFYQKLNGSEKVNKRHRYVDKTYVVNNKGSQEKVNTAAIRYNMICLYTHEPVNASRIYSDKYQKYLAIQKIADRHYKIVFPDGNYSEYFYEGGTCTRVEVNNSLFNVVMLLKK